MEHNHSSRLSRKDSWEGYSHVDLKWIVSNGGKFNIRVESVKGGRTWTQSEYNRRGRQPPAGLFNKE